MPFLRRAGKRVCGTPLGESFLATTTSERMRWTATPTYDDGKTEWKIRKPDRYAILPRGKLYAERVPCSNQMGANSK